MNSNMQKKSGHPTQPDNRFDLPKSVLRKRKIKTILHRIKIYYKLADKSRLLFALGALIAVICLICAGIATLAGNENEVEKMAPSEITEQQAEPTEYIFRDGEGFPLNVQNLTATWAKESGMEKRYDITDEERWEIASVVTQEAGGEPYAGMVAVAQCILNGCEDELLRPFDLIEDYGYTSKRPEPSEEALKAVAAVFDFGQVVTDEPIKYFYAPAITESAWHETQDYVLTINGHRFFKEAK